TVTPVNDNPLANPDTFTVAEDSGATVLNVLANDTTGPDTGETLSVTAVTQPAHGGTVTLVNGVVAFTPAPDFFGTTSFTYTVSDGNGGTATATATVTVTPVNDAPVARPDTLTVAEDSGATVVDVLGNDDAGPDSGETLTVTAVTQPAHGGTVTLVNGVVRFTPAPDFFGTTSFTYTVSDGNGGTATATVNVNVTPVNDNPLANPDTFTVAEDSGATVLNVLANDTTGPDTGETLTVTAVTQPAHGGTVTLVNGVVRFTPAPDFFGTTSFTYTVSDGNGGTATAIATVTVTPVNDAPVARPDTFTVAEDSGATVLNVLANDTTGPDTGETLSVTAVSQPAHGGTVTLVNGVVRFTPAPDFFGTTSFTYTVSDGNGGTATATATVTVTPVNDAPVARPDTLTVAEDSGATVVDVLGNDDAGPDTGETLTVTAVTQPAHGGTVTLVNGVVRFTPAPDFFGTTSFTYTVSDGNGGTATATATVTVTPVNDAPVARPDTLTVAEDSGATVVDVLGNDDTGPDTGETLTVTAVTQPAHGGTVTLVNGVVRFTPAPDFFGTTSFTYTVSDGNGGTATATATVTVTPVNDAPVARPDTLTVAEDSGTAVVDVLGNDGTGPDSGETLGVVAVTQPGAGAGTVTLVNGAVRFTPAAGFSGTTSFTYTVSDGNGGTATATATITVTPVEKPPVPKPVPAPAPAPAPAPEPVAPPPAPAPAPVQRFDSTLVAHPVLDRAAVVIDSTARTVVVESTDVGDIYTRSSGFRAMVAPANEPTLRTFRGIEDQVVPAAKQLNLQVPADAFVHTQANETVTLTATLADGRPLPSWLQFDGKAGTFKGEPPAGQALDLRIKVQGRDSQGREANAMFRIKSGTEAAAERTDGPAEVDAANGTEAPAAKLRAGIGARGGLDAQLMRGDALTQRQGLWQSQRNGQAMAQRDVAARRGA
uniref:Ig-like domain-containing protein n=1 Tax=Azohydromonas aeria TaxID=2590212 RepID=UPI0012FCD52E